MAAFESKRRNKELNPPILEITNLGLSKSNNEILSNVSTKTIGNSLVALIGPNGSGKTSLLRTISNLESYTGSIELNGSNASNFSQTELSHLISWTPSTFQLPFSYSVLDIVLMGRFPSHAGSPRKSDTDKCLEVLQKMEIAEFQSRIVTTLSSGELQKVMIAQALASDAKIILMDEPCANLDISASMNLLQNLKSTILENRLVLFSVHDINLAQKYADKMICLSKGSVVAEGPPKEILSEKLVWEVFGARSDWLKNKLGEDQFVFY